MRDGRGEVRDHLSRHPFPGTMRLLTETQTGPADPPRDFASFTARSPGGGSGSGVMWGLHPPHVAVLIVLLIGRGSAEHANGLHRPCL
jgi:hypothetical protein